MVVRLSTMSLVLIGTSNWKGSVQDVPMNKPRFGDACPGTVEALVRPYLANAGIQINDTKSTIFQFFQDSHWQGSKKIIVKPVSGELASFNAWIASQVGLSTQPDELCVIVGSPAIAQIRPLKKNVKPLEQVDLPIEKAVQFYQEKTLSILKARLLGVACDFSFQNLFYNEKTGEVVFLDTDCVALPYLIDPEEIKFKKVMKILLKESVLNDLLEWMESDQFKSLKTLHQNRVENLNVLSDEETKQWQEAFVKRLHDISNEIKSFLKLRQREGGSYDNTNLIFDLKYDVFSIKAFSSDACTIENDSDDGEDESKEYPSSAFLCQLFR